MVKRYFIALFLLLSAFAVKAQDQNAIDSLKTVIQSAEHDTSVCNAYLSWGEQIYWHNHDTALTLWQKAHDIAKSHVTTDISTPLEKRYLFYLAEALINIGFFHELQGDIQMGLEYYHKSLKIYEAINNSPDPGAEKAIKIGLATCLNNIGSISKLQGDIPKALKYHNKSLKINEQLNNKLGVATSSNNIGVIYEQQGNLSKSLEYYHKSLAIYQELGEKGSAAITLNNIGYIYKGQGDIDKALEYHQMSLKMNEEIGNKRGMAASLNYIGFAYRDQSDISNALKSYHKSLKIHKEMGNKSGIATSLNNIGIIYKEQSDFTKALECYNQSLKIQKEMGDRLGTANSLCNIGHIELLQGAVAQALEHGKAGLRIAREIGSPYRISVNAGLLYKIAKEQGDFKEALEMFELHIQMRDSIKNEETQKAAIRQQTKYEFEKAQLVKEQEEKETVRLEAEVMSRRNNLQYSVILIAILVLFGGVLALGFINVSERMAEGIIFFSFLILFEFLLVLADPYIEGWSGGAPGIKLLFNAGIAALIFPAHAFFESRLKGRLVKSRT